VAEHTAGSPDSANLWVEFDLGQPHEVTRARLFGDANGSWVSMTWTLEHRLDEAAGWTAAFADATAEGNDWSEQPLALTARYLRIAVAGNPSVPATQARELEIYGAPAGESPDAGLPPDAGLSPDAGSPAEGDDAGAGADMVDGGCACAASANGVSLPGAFALLLLMASIRRRWRIGTRPMQAPW